MKKSIKLLKRSSLNTVQLDSIRIGDLIADEYGKFGKVSDIEKIDYHRELHYYFYLDKKGTILVIL